METIFLFYLFICLLDELSTRIGLKTGFTEANPSYNPNNQGLFFWNRSIFIIVVTSSLTAVLAILEHYKINTKPIYTFIKMLSIAYALVPLMNLIKIYGAVA